jgi:IS5 family transposase
MRSCKPGGWHRYGCNADCGGHLYQERRQGKKGNEWYFGMKAHIGMNADSGLVHTVRGMAGKVSDVVQANSLLHRQETDAFGDAGYQVCTNARTPGHRCAGMSP